MPGLTEVGLHAEPANDGGSGLQTRASRQVVDVLADVIVCQHANKLREVDETQQVVQVLAAGPGRKPLLRGVGRGAGVGGIVHLSEAENRCHFLH